MRNPQERKRIRSAAITVLVFACCFLPLAISSSCEKASQSTSTLDYLCTPEPVPASDPLKLTDHVAAFTLTGVSEDGSVIGYSSELSWEQSSGLLKQALQRDGWSVVDDNGSGLLSLYHEGPEPKQGASLFVQCIPIGQESSIVVQRW